MPTAVLLGFSTTGKSHILGEFKEKFGDTIETVDTDAELARDFDGHIYGIFFAKAHGRDRSEALRYIEAQEARVLDSIRASEAPRLVAAGPGIPLRQPQWNGFIDRVKPVCFYLQISAEDACEGLLRRRSRHGDNLEVSAHPAFGSWDQDVTTEFDGARWRDVDPRRAVINVGRHMGGLDVHYRRYCGNRIYDSVRLRCDKPYKAEFYGALCDEIGASRSSS